MTKINTIDELKDKCSDDAPVDFFILLASGLRSSKSILLLDDGRFSVINEVDDSEDILTVEELFNTSKTLIGTAINDGRFYAYS